MTKVLLLAAALAGLAASADQVEMKNGDHFTGRVVSLTADTVILENENIGKVTLPRAKVSLLSLGDSAPKPVAPVAATNTAAGSSDISAALRQLGSNSNFVARVKGQFLADAGPEANQKFDDMMAGLASGNIDLASLRAQAQDAANKLRAYQHDAGPEADSMNTYLTILNTFLQETSAVTNR